jgi:outer membrane protein assembly factor BamB
MSQTMVFVGAHHMKSKDGFVGALEAETGSLLWRYSLPNASSSYPVTHQGCVYFSASNGITLTCNSGNASRLLTGKVTSASPHRAQRN